MHKFLLSLICAAVTLAGTAQQVVLKHYRLDVGEFSRLNLVDGLNVDYRCTSDADSIGCAFFETSDSVASKILFSNNKGELKIQKDFDDPSSPLRNLPTITVCSRHLSEAKNSGDSTLRVLHPNPQAEFKVVLIGNGRIVVRGLDCTKLSAAIKTGNGTIALQGRCDDAVLSNTGVGTIQADNLQARDASCRFFGTGTTGVNVSGTLTVKGTLAGKLYYSGNPQRIRNYALGVKLFPLSK